MKRFTLALTLLLCLFVPSRAGDVHIPPAPCHVGQECPDDGGNTSLDPVLAELYGETATLALTL